MIETKMTDRVRRLATWLQGLKLIKNTQPVEVTIGRQTWEGVAYTGLGARRYYLLGILPQHYNRRKACYRLEVDERDYYVIKEWRNEDHPFGTHWLMGAWDGPGTIDEHEPYSRIPMKIVNLT